MRKMVQRSEWKGPNAAIKLLALTWIIVCTCFALAQAPGNVECASTSGIVKGQPFSAHRFRRKIHVGKDGVEVIVSESNHAILARDESGRIFIAAARPVEATCDLPGIASHTTCSVWSSLIFDPYTGVVWHWLDGDSADKTQYAKIDLLNNQIDEAKRNTSDFRESSEDSGSSNIELQNLGEHDVEGLKARGLRVMTTGRDEAGTVTWKFHEVWTSACMHLVIRVVDRNSDGDMVISGLEHISLRPDTTKFQLPLERILRHPQNETGSFAGSDLEDLAGWFIRL